jgi:protease IV
MAKKQDQKNRWGIIIAVLIFLFILSYIFAGIISIIIGPTSLDTGNIAVIPVKGIIMVDDSDNLFSSGIASSSRIVDDIIDASKDPSIEAIILEINSPGGAPVATDEISRAIKETNKTTVAWIREVGASGAYWIASSTDHVISNKMSIVGSIGVIGSYLDFSGFINDWNVTYERLVAGKYKDTGVPFRELTEQERKLLQKKLDLLHQEFKDEVQRNRQLTNSQIENVGNGEFYLGSEAITLGLVDQLGGEKEAIAYIENNLNITADIVVYEHKRSLLDTLAGLSNENSFYVGKGIGDSLTVKTQRIGMFS